jgi:hypothetical protein
MLIRFLPLLVLTVVIFGSQKPRHHLPPPLEAKNCNSKNSKDEYPNDRFARKGGRETKASVRYEKDLLTAPDIEQGRDLSRYERLNVSNPKPMFAYEMDGAQIFIAARTFVWEHWRNQKLGYLTMTGSSVDATSTSHIFIEPDDTGRWRVAWRIVRHTGKIDDLPTYYAVQWVRLTDWDKPGVPLRAEEKPDAAKHKLEFRDKCGDVEDTL